MTTRSAKHFAIIAVASAAALALIPSASLATQAFWDLGDNFNPTGVSDDGWFSSGFAPVAGQGAFWTGTTDHVEIGGLNATGVSGDASVVVGNVSGTGALETAAMWTEDGGWEILEPFPEAASCDAFFTSSWGVNGDGSVIVGLAWVPNCRAHAFRWTEASGMVDLGSTVVDRSSRANAVSGDGQTVVGWQDASDGFRQGAFWREDVVQSLSFTQTLLFEDHPDFGVNAVGEAQAATPDGSVIVGGSTVLGEAYRWTGGPYVEPIGGLSGFNWRSTATAVSDDGGVIVGFSGFGLDRAGFIWTEATGLVNLTDFLIGLGITELEDWNLSTPTGISSDGTVIVGFGAPGGNPFARNGWRVDLNQINFSFQAVDVPAPILADANGLSFDAIQPNPFRASTQITYSVPAQDRVTLAVYDIAGRSVQTLVDRTVSAGRHTVTWNGRDATNRPAAAGVYFIRVSGSGQAETERITLLR